MPKAPPHYQLVQTDDGSPTLFSELFHEACHSTAGAVAETHFHYLQGCEITSFMDQFEEINILEVGFGTGTGWQETQKLFNHSPHKKLNFYSLELDAELIKWSQPQAVEKTMNGMTCFELENDNSRLTVLIGDARKTIHHFPLSPIHAIYQDAFSPKRNPTLWTHQWFSDLKKVAHPLCRLSTYSASISIRKSLLKAGWSVQEGPAFAQKRSSTRANLSGVMNEDFLKKLETHDIAALDDKDFL